MAKRLRRADGRSLSREIVKVLSKVLSKSKSKGGRKRGRMVRVGSKEWKRLTRSRSAYKRGRMVRVGSKGWKRLSKSRSRRSRSRSLPAYPAMAPRKRRAYAPRKHRAATTYVGKGAVTYGPSLGVTGDTSRGRKYNALGGWRNRDLTSGYRMVNGQRVGADHLQQENGKWVFKDTQVWDLDNKKGYKDGQAGPILPADFKHPTSWNETTNSWNYA